MARRAFKSDLDLQHHTLTVSVLMSGLEGTTSEHINSWIADNQNFITRWQKILTDLRSSSVIDFGMLYVAAQELSEAAKTNIMRLEQKD